MPTFDPPYTNLDERVPLTADHYNALVTAMVNHFSNLNGVDFEAPFDLSKTDQDLEGGAHSIYNFRKWFGYGTTDVCVRDVCGYGAKGDGTTDDLTAIQAALDDMPTTGGALFFPPGTYISSGTIKMAGTTGTRSKIMCFGCGAASIIKRDSSSDNGPLIQMGYGEVASEGMTLMGLSFDGNSANQGASAVQSLVSMADTDHAKILFCNLTDSAQDGIHVYGSNDGAIYKCRVYANERHGIYQGNIQRTCNDLLITDSFITDNSNSGILLGPVTVAQIADCIIYNNAENGIGLYTQPNLSLSDVSIEGCTCKGNGNVGIHLNNAYSGTRISGCAIEGNTCNDNTNYGIALVGAANAGIVFCTICGNICDSNLIHGIYLYTHIKYCTLTGNTCSNNRGATTGSGIYADGTEGDEIELNSICANPCVNDATDEYQQYGIYMGTNTKDNTLIANTTYGNGTSNIYDDGDDNDIAHNTGA